MHLFKLERNVQERPRTRTHDDTVEVRVLIYLFYGDGQRKEGTIHHHNTSNGSVIPKTLT